MIEHRRSRRRRVQASIEVYDAMSEELIGHLGNLSVDGLLLVSRRPIPDDALFQFLFTLPRGVSAHSRRLAAPAQREQVIGIEPGEQVGHGGRSGCGGR